MRTQALRVSVGAYSNGTWHVAVISDTYERGVLVNSSIESLSHPETKEQVRWNVKVALERLFRLEEERLEREAADESQARESAAADQPIGILPDPSDRTSSV